METHQALLPSQNLPWPSSHSLCFNHAASFLPSESCAVPCRPPTLPAACPQELILNHAEMPSCLQSLPSLIVFCSFFKVLIPAWHPIM